jgi:glycosyltransferase 2 family protein
MGHTIWKKGIPWLIAAGVFAWCLRQIWATFQWEQIFQVMRQANLLWFGLGGTLANLAFGLLRSWRWSILLRNLKVVVPFWRLHLCNVGVMCLTIITPLQSGELLKVELLKKHCQMERFSGYSSFVVERLIDLLVVLAIAVFSSISLLREVQFSISQATLVYAGILALLVLSVALWGLRRMVLPTQLNTALGQFGVAVRSCTRNGRSLLGVILLSAAAWIMVAVTWQVCLKSIEIDLSLLQTLSLMSLTTMISLLSFIPGALGVSEVSVTTLLTQLGVSPSLAQAGAVVIRGQSFLFILISLAHWGTLHALPPSRQENQS